MLGGGLKYFLFSSLPGEMIQFDEHIFSDELKPPTSLVVDPAPWTFGQTSCWRSFVSRRNRNTRHVEFGCCKGCFISPPKKVRSFNSSLRLAHVIPSANWHFVCKQFPNKMSRSFLEHEGNKSLRKTTLPWPVNEPCSLIFHEEPTQSQQAPGCQPDSDRQRYRSTRVAPRNP